MLQTVGWTLALVLGIPLLLLLGISVLNARMMLAMRRGDFAIVVAEIEGDDPRLESVAALVDPAQRAGFEWDGIYETEIAGVHALVAVWRKPHTDECVVHTITQAGQGTARITNTITEISTRFDDHNELCTADSANALAGPSQDGRFAWALPGLELDELLRRHDQARDEIMATHNLTPRAPTTLVADDLACDVLERAHYVTSLPLWQIRGVIWYFTRNRKANRELWRDTKPASHHHAHA